MLLMSTDPRTIVFVHAHPDDEALLTAGTMARAHAEGLRVVLVTATNGAGGLTSTAMKDALGDRRLAELHEAAAHLGVARIVALGLADSGLRGEEPDGMVHRPLSELLTPLVQILDEEDAAIVVGYDPAGGYGHPDHRHVHRAVRSAATLAQRTPRLFEATLPREPIRGAVRAAARLRLTPRTFDPAEFEHAWTPRALITHRVDVRRHLRAKRAALRAHASQAQADGTTRTLGVLTRLPPPLLAMLLGTEYYVRIPDSSTARARSTSTGSS